MRKYVCFGLFLLSIVAFAQPKQENSEELERRHGFKNIRLATPIDSVAGAEFKKDFLEQDEFEAKLYEIKKQFLGTIGDVKVQSIALKVYKGLIYEITVETDRDPRIMEGLEKAFGKSTYSVRTKGYHWRAQSLKLAAYGGKSSQKLIYESYTVLKMMKADKGKKVDEIADDF
jgi:hypothetical protein